MTISPAIAWIAFLIKKSDAKDAIKNFVRSAERQHTSIKIQRFHNDNGGEYVNDDLLNYYESAGITVEHTHQSQAPTAPLQY